jgi:hypothetical protein
MLYCSYCVLCSKKTVSVVLRRKRQGFSLRAWIYENKKRFTAALATCTAAVVTLSIILPIALQRTPGTGVPVEKAPSVLCLEINPKAVFSVDKEGVVTGVVAMNQDADVILADETRINRMEGETAEQAMETFVDYAAKLGYLNLNTQTAIRVSEYNNENASVRAEAVRQKLEAYFVAKGSKILVVQDTLDGKKPEQSAPAAVIPAPRPVAAPKAPAAAKPTGSVAPKQDFFRTMDAKTFREQEEKQAAKPVSTPFVSRIPPVASELGGRVTVSDGKKPMVTHVVLPKEEEKSAPVLRAEQAAAAAPVQETILPESAEPEQMAIEAAQEAPWRFAGEVLRTYIIAEDGSDVWLIDKHAAHERINFDRLKAAAEPIVSQQLLSGEAVKLSPEDCAALLEHLPLLEEFGFEAEDFGGERKLEEIVVAGEVDFDSRLAPVRRIPGLGIDAALEGVKERAAEPGTLDVLPASWREFLEETRFKSKLVRRLAVAGGLWALAMGILFGVPVAYGFLAERQRDLSRKHARQYKAVAQMREKVNLVKKYSDHSRGALEIMKALSDRLPEGITLGSWSFEREDPENSRGGVRVSGEADSADLVYDFKDAMSELSDGEEKVFGTVNLIGPTSGKGGKQRFDLECRFLSEEAE